MVVAVLFGRGGIGDVGRHVVKIAVEKGIPVRAISREEPEFLSDKIASVTQLETLAGDVPGLENVKVDILSKDTKDLEAALDGVDTIVSCMGNRQPTMERWMLPGTENLLKVMKAKNINRLVVLTSVGMNEDWPPMRWRFEGKIFGFMFNTIMRKAYKDISGTETLVRESGQDYLIVRPTGLTPEYAPLGEWKLLPPGSDGKIDGVQCGVSVAKEDVAEFMLNEAINPTIHNKAVTIATVPPPKEKK